MSIRVAGPQLIIILCYASQVRSLSQQCGRTRCCHKTSVSIRVAGTEPIALKNSSTVRSKLPSQVCNLSQQCSQTQCRTYRNNAHARGASSPGSLPHLWFATQVQNLSRHSEAQARAVARCLPSSCFTHLLLARSFRAEVLFSWCCGEYIFI